LRKLSRPHSGRVLVETVLVPTATGPRRPFSSKQTDCATRSLACYVCAREWLRGYAACMQGASWIEVSSPKQKYPSQTLPHQALIRQAITRQSCRKAPQIVIIVHCARDLAQQIFCQNRERRGLERGSRSTGPPSASASATLSSWFRPVPSGRARTSTQPLFGFSRHLPGKGTTASVCGRTGYLSHSLPLPHQS
jgi:hypothetical protein